MKVLYYDFEQGEAAMLSHISVAFGHNLEKVKRATKNLYLRDSTKTLNDDLQAVPPPALIVVDSIQKIPTSIEFRRTGIDRWVHRLEALKRQGYTVLAVSEVGRGSYHESNKKDAAVGRLGGFKESGEIEYAADFAAQLFAVPDLEGTVEFHVVKNRHRPDRGYLFDLERVNDWWFKEVGGRQSEEEGRKVD